MSILKDADELINGERAEQYGDVTQQFRRIAIVWSGILDTIVAPADVGLMMAGLKLVRATDRSEREDLLDAAGYVGCTAQVRRQDGLPEIRREAPEDTEPEPEVASETAPELDQFGIPLGAEPIGGEAECYSCGDPLRGHDMVKCPNHAEWCPHCDKEVSQACLAGQGTTPTVLPQQPRATAKLGRPSPRVPGYYKPL